MTQGTTVDPGVRATLEENVLTLVLDNPGTKNAISKEMGRLLAGYLRDAALDPVVRVVVLKGAGSAFCSGGDVRKLGSADTSDPITQGLEMLAVRQSRNAEPAILLHTIRKPTIAMVRGPAAGAGLSLAVACDFRIASENAYFTTAFVRVGGCGDSGIGYFLTSLVGASKARELLFLSDKLGADEALRIGLVNKVVADEQLETETAALAQRLADGPPVAHYYIKENLNRAQAMRFEEYVELEGRNMGRCLLTEDFKAAAAAFAEKRKPVFSGR